MDYIIVVELLPVYVMDLSQEGLTMFKDRGREEGEGGRGTHINLKRLTFEEKCMENTTPSQRRFDRGR